MTSQNQTGKDAKTLNTPKDDAAAKGAAKAAEASEVERELTDEELAAVAGGVTSGHPGGCSMPLSQDA